MIRLKFLIDKAFLIFLAKRLEFFLSFINPHSQKKEIIAVGHTCYCNKCYSSNLEVKIHLTVRL